MHKLGYLRVSYRILKRDFYKSAQSNGVEQHSEQSRKPSSQQWILKKLKGVYIIAALWVTDYQIYSSVSYMLHFLTWMIWYQYLYTKNYVYKAVYTYHQVFCLPWYKTREPDGLQRELYAVRLYRVLWELDTLLTFFYYELLLALNHRFYSPMLLNELNIVSIATFIDSAVFLYILNHNSCLQCLQRLTEA